METGTFIRILKSRLTEELPGLASQMKMVPAARKEEIEKRSLHAGGRKAAVLVCLYPDRNGEICFVLIRRNEYDGVHSGQISFPGGSYEEGDENLVATALREAREETGIVPEEMEILGSLTPVYIPPSNFHVQPFVGWAGKAPRFIPDPAEVSEIIEVPLKNILRAENRLEKTIPHREFKEIRVPCYMIGGHVVWGATAMMLSELGDILEGLA
mgnify:CR=1 FL=1